MEQSKAEGLRLLVLDAGDIRCLSQLAIIEEFLSRVEWKRKEEPLLPCNYFDMIAAAGPAGIIVIFLVVFRMTIQEAKEVFIQMWLAIFVDDHCKPEDRSSKLERFIGDLLRRRNMSPNRKLLHNNRNNECEGFVCAVSPQAPSVCQKFRSYKSPEKGIDVTVIEAIRATCAVPDRFTSVKVGLDHQKQEFIAGDAAFYNLTQQAIKELYDSTSPDTLVSCVLSLGCGKPGIIQASTLYSSHQYNHRRTAIMQAERIADELEARIGSSGVYYRFSVDYGLESPEAVLLHRLGDIETYSRTYLQQAVTNTAMDKCVNASENVSRITTKTIYCSQITSSIAVHGLPPLCTSFVMRKELLDSMFHALFDSNEPSQRIMVLSGMGGSGKTQMVLKFVRTFSYRFNHVLFVDGTSNENIKMGIISKVRELGVSCKTFEEALAYLAHHDRSIKPGLLILDNVDDPSIELAPLLPPCDHGFIIVTSRNPNLGGISSPNSHIIVDVMTEREAMDALLSTISMSIEQASDQDRTNASAIIKALGHLPVAIVQAGSFIKRRRCLDTYLSYLESNRRDALSIPAQAQRDIHYHAVYATLDVTLKALSSPAREFLGILACFNYTGFPVAIIERAARHNFLFEPLKLLDRSAAYYETIQFTTGIFCVNGHWSRFKLDALLEELEQYSLLVRVRSYSVVTLRFHLLVHAWVFDQIAAQGLAKYQQAALRLLICGTAEEDEDLYDFLVPHLSSIASTWKDAHVNDLAGVAKLMLWEGKRRQALDLWEAILRRVTAVHGENHLSTSRVRLQLALSYDSSKSFQDWQRIASLINEEINFLVRELSYNDPETMEAVSHLSERKLDWWRQEPQDSQAAFVSEQQILVSLWKEKPGQRSEIFRLKAMELLARIYQGQRRWDAAHSILTDVLRSREILHGAEHTSTLRTRELLASFHLGRQNGDATWLRTTSGSVHTMSIDTLKNVVNQRKKAQGPYHRDTLKALTGLAKSYWNQSRILETVETLKEVVDGWRVRAGAYDDSTLKARESLAEVYDRCQRYEDAKGEWEKIISDCREGGHLENVYCIRASTSLAILSQKQGNHEDAIYQWCQIIQLCISSGDTHHRHHLRAMESLARLYENRGQYPEAVLHWERAIELCKLENDIRTADYLRGTEALAQLHTRYGRYLDGATQWKRFIEADTQGDKVHISFPSLMRLYQSMGFHLRPPDHWEIITLGEDEVREVRTKKLVIMRQMAGAYEAYNMDGGAEAQWKKVVKAYQDTGQELSEDALRSMGSLAQLYEKKQLYDSEMALWKQVVEERKRRNGIRNIHTLIPLRFLAKVQEKLKLDEEAVETWSQVIEGGHFLYGPCETVANARYSLAVLLEKLGRDESAIGEWEQVLAIMAGSKPLYLHTTQIREKLANSYAKLGRFESAANHWEQLIKIHCGSYGLHHPSTLAAREALAGIYEKLHRYREAISQWRFIITGRTNWSNKNSLQWRPVFIVQPERVNTHTLDAMVAQTKHGVEDQPDWGTINALERLAHLYQKSSMYNEAINTWKQIISMRHSYHPTGLDSKALDAVISLTAIYEEKGQYYEAERQWNEAIKRFSRGEMELKALENMADFMARSYGYNEAAKKWEQSIVWNPARSRERLAEWCEQHQYYEGAIVQWEKVVKELRRMPKQTWDYRAIHRAVAELTRIYELFGRTQDSANLWEQVVVDCRAIYPSHDTRTLAAMERLARLYERQNCLQEAINQWEYIVGGRSMKIGSREELLRAMNNLADLYARVGRSEDADLLLEDGDSTSEEGDTSMD